MTATCALTLPRRPHSVPGMRLLPVAPNEPPYDDEIEAAAASGRPARTRIRPTRRTGGTADRSGRPAAAPGGGGHRRGASGGRSAPPLGGQAPGRPNTDHPNTDHPNTDRPNTDHPDTDVPDTAVDRPNGRRNAEEQAGGGTVAVDRSPRQLTVPEQVFTEAGPTLGPASSDLP
ncbi:hypothetical protein ND748_32925, partial [Frankia sp. AiPs1]|nr:hypothetical protein [Frankia sp. AiPs1]